MLYFKIYRICKIDIKYIYKPFISLCNKVFKASNVPLVPEYACTCKNPKYNSIV